MIAPYFVLIPLVAAFLITLFSRKKKNVAVCLAIFAGIALLILGIVSFVLVSKADGPLLYTLGNWKIPWTINFVLDYFTSFMLITIGIIALASLVFSINYMTRYTELWKFYTLFMLMLAGMNGFVITGDLFNLFIFMEIALIAAYALVGFGCEAEELEAAFKYTVIGSLSSIFVLLAVGILYAITSTLNMADIGHNIISNRGFILYFVYGLLLTGFGLKAAIVPFHAWLPDAHSSAPAPVSAMLSGVLIKTLGIYALIRVFYHVFSISTTVLNLFLILGAITLLLGVLMAKLQFDFKRLLAFHSISQIGYIILGLGLGTPLGILGAVFHLFNHSIFKSLLFLNAGSVEYATGTRDLREMGGLGKQLKPAAVTSMIASLSISGIPPFNGFFSKLIIILAAFQAKQFIFALVAALGSILTLASFLKVQRYVFYGDPHGIERKCEKLPLCINGSMIFLAVLCVLSVVLILPGIKELILDKVVETIQNRQVYLNIISGGQL